MSTFDADDLVLLDNTYARRDSTPTFDESFINAVVGPYQTAFNTGSSAYFFIAPFPLKIVSGWFALYSSVTASNTNYLRISLARRRNADYQRIVSGYTTTSGQANQWGSLTYGTSYSWNSFAFDPTYSQMQPGDQLAFEISTFGSATGPNGPAPLTIGYVPL